MNVQKRENYCEQRLKDSRIFEYSNTVRSCSVRHNRGSRKVYDTWDIGWEETE